MHRYIYIIVCNKQYNSVIHIQQKIISIIKKPPGPKIQKAASCSILQYVSKQIEQQNHEPYFEKNWKHIFFFIQLSASFTYLFLHWSFLLFGDYQMILFSKKDKYGSMNPIFSPDVLQAQTMLNPAVQQQSTSHAKMVGKTWFITIILPSRALQALLP